MKWEIKHGFRQDVLLNAAHEKTVMIRRNNDTYLITDALGQALYLCKQEKPLVIRIHGTDEGCAKIKLSDTNGISSSPKASYMEVIFSGTMITIEKTPQRDFIISINNNPFGRITGILKKYTDLEFQDSFTADIIAVFYILTLYMLHADDIDII